MFISNSLGAEWISILIALMISIMLYYKWTYQYWQRKNLPYLKPTIPFGNAENPLNQKHNALIIQNLYNQIKARGWKHGGLFMILAPGYLVVDLEYVKNIMTKDFHHFVDRGLYYNEKDDPLSAHLFNIGGQKWRNLRIKLTPAFTSGKMKMMFQTLLDCEPNLLEKIETYRTTKTPIDMKATLECFTTDVIGSCVFNFNTFKEQNSPFRKYSREFLLSSRLGFLKFMFVANFPVAGAALRLLQTSKDVSKFIINIVKDTVSYREKNNYTREDFIQFLIDMKNKQGYKHDGNTLTIEELAAQCFVFFIAGFETSSTTMTFALYELARNQDLQKKVRDEINTVLVKHGGKITYDAVQEMKYMDQVINETLRMYPPVPFVTRKCVQDYKISGLDVVIDKGTFVIIPIFAIHHDKEFYNKPEKFDPDRFTEKNKQGRHRYAHIPFGAGPRLCIGMRFGMMQSKVGLTSLLKNYKFTVNKKTREPLEMTVTSFVLAAEGDIWLDAEKV